MRRGIIAVVFVLSSAACDQNIAPPTADPGYLISRINADSVNITFTGFDSVRITHESGSLARSREFQSVGVGISDSTGYRELVSSGSTYDPAGDIFLFDYDFALSFDSTKAVTPITVRYYQRGSGSTDIDTAILQYKYPYSDSEILVTNSIMMSPGHFQDIDRIAKKFYFHPTGNEGLYEYDFDTGITRTLLDYNGGDHIAADSVFVFCDIDHNSILRYNVLLDQVDLTVATFPSQGLRGLETYEGFLYAIDQGPPSTLYKYEYDGTRVDSLPFQWLSYHLTISDGILYTGNGAGSITRIDIELMSQLPSVIAPARNLEGIRVYEGFFYFCDYYRSLVCSVPLQDFR